MPPAQVTIVVIAFESAGVLPACLGALPPEVPVIVVDNASRDGSAALAARLRPEAQVIRAAGNLGFGRAANLGFAAVTTPFGLLLNADAECTPGMVPALLAAAARYPEAGMLAPATYDHDGQLQFGRLTMFQRRRRRGRPHPPEGDCCAPYVGGAAMFLRLAAFRAVGGFDPEIFLYYEDDDLCMRLRRAGYSLVHVHGARLRHGSGKSSAPSAALSWGKEWHMGWSRQHMERKYHGRPVALLRGLLGIAGLGLRLALRWGHPSRGKWAARLAGTAAQLGGRRAILPGAPLVR